MAKGLDDLEGIIKTISSDIENNASKSVRAVALAVDKHIVLATPVDTGRARANWQVGVNQEKTDIVESTDKSGMQSISKGSSDIAKAKSPNDVIYITNNLPYIQRLNEGHSSQAPAGFVDKAVQAGDQELKKISLVKANKNG